MNMPMYKVHKVTILFTYFVDIIEPVGDLLVEPVLEQLGVVLCPLDLGGQPVVLTIVVALLKGVKLSKAVKKQL